MNTFFRAVLLARRSATLLKRETPTQVFSCKIFNTYFEEHPHFCVALVIYRMVLSLNWNDIHCFSTLSLKTFWQTQNPAIYLQCFPVFLLVFFGDYQGASLANPFGLKKQPLEVFCKKRCSQKFLKIYRNTLVPESLFK